MTRFVMQEYLAGFCRKGEWRQKINIWFPLLVGMIYFAAEFVMNDGTFSAGNAVLVSGICLPLLFIMVSLFTHPVQLPKMMYLCPMQPEERKAYIQKSYWFRFTVQMGISVIGVLVVLCVSSLDFFLAGMILANDVMLSSLVYPARRSKDTDSKMEYILFCVLIPLCMLSVVVLLAFAIGEETGMLAKIILLLLFGFIELPPFVKYQKYIRLEMEDALTFEGKPVAEMRDER